MYKSSGDELKEDETNEPNNDTDIQAMTSAVEDDDSSVITSDDEWTGTVVRRRRDGNAFLGEPGAEPGVNDDSWDDDEYIGLIPMLCSRCVKLLKRTASDQRSKRFIVIFNIILSVCGCLLICVGLWIYIRQDSLFYAVLLLKNDVTEPMIIINSLSMGLIAVGTVLIVLSFVGACGASTECICFIGFHVVMAICCLTTQVIFAIIVAALKNKINSNMTASLQYQIRHQYNITGSSSVNSSSLTYRVTSAWNQLQQQLECCGSHGPSDYHYSTWFNQTPDSDGLFVPPSCCSSSPSADGLSYQCQFQAVAVLHHEFKYSTVQQLVQTQGCYAAIVNWLSSYSALFAVIIISLDVLLVIDIVYCCLLIKIARRKQSDYSWYT